MVNTPYAHTQLSHTEFVRTFDVNVAPHELVWHRDHNTRSITVVEGEGWRFQFDNQLPRELKVGDQFQVCAGVYHRLIKGDTDLKLQIVETEPIHQE
jgi:quercetin dioxygenase-like cupin family protein